MLIRRPDDILPSEITDPAVYHARRRFMAQAGTLALASALPITSNAAGLGPIAASPLSTTEPPTSRRAVTTYNNFYELGTDKADPAENTFRLKPTPWTLRVEGLVNKPRSFGIEELIKLVPLEERIYRMRCVEGWSMVIPWRGFALADLIRRFKPTAQAKYVAFTTLEDREQMPGQRHAVLDWPYTEGLRMDEAMHPLSLLATGMYGRDLPNQNGAPLRLVVPWKYGFKSIKSIVRIEFTERQPPTSWNEMQGREYGFYSNVNPDVDHPRWSQKTERRLAGSGSRLFANRIPTLPFNGYAEQVAGLYAGMDLHKFF